jgi:hypothetical protein
VSRDLNREEASEGLGLAGLSGGQLVVPGGVLVLHAITFAIAMLPVFRALGEGDEVDPLVEARLEEEERTTEVRDG